MEQDKRSDLIEKFDTGELSKDIIPPNFTDPDVLFEVLTKLLTAENRQDEMGIIRKAYELAKEAHKDQKKKIRGTISDSPGLCGNHFDTAGYGQGDDCRRTSS